MATLVCRACRHDPGNGRICQVCQANIAEPHALIDLDSQADPRRPETPEPAFGRCSVEGCDRPAERGRFKCEVHRLHDTIARTRDYALVCSSGGWQVDVPDGTTVLLGRGAASAYAQLLSAHHYVSHRHASLTAREGSLVVVDHASRNGTRVRGERIAPETAVVLVPGDGLTLGGQVTFYVR